MPPKGTPRAGANDWTDSQMASIHTMLNPRSVAIVGATPRMQYGGRFLAKALQYKDRLKVFAVNPRYEEVMGVRSYPNVTALPETPDVAAVVVPVVALASPLRNLRRFCCRGATNSSRKLQCMPFSMFDRYVRFWAAPNAE